jgi:hypothetical protein
METQQIMEFLPARMNASMKEHMQEMTARIDASHKKMMALLDAHHGRTVASLGKTEATDFIAIPEKTESATEHQ